MLEVVFRQVSSWTPVGQDARLPYSPAEVSRLLFFSTKVRWACPGLFLSKPWLLRFGSQECDSKLTADDIILSANPFPAKDLFGDTKTQRITICHGLHRRPLAPKSFLHHVDRPSAHDKKVANSLPGLLKSPQVFCWPLKSLRQLPPSLLQPEKPQQLRRFTRPCPRSISGSRRQPASHSPQKPANCKPIKA